MLDYQGITLGIIALYIFVPVASSHEISGCYGDTVTISCAADEKINILGDFYGLSPEETESKVCGYSENDICVVPSHSHSSVAKQVCNGRTNCIFTISERHTCINGKKETTYQQIKYECIRESQIRSMCTDETWVSTSGFLTSANYPIFYPPRASCTCTLTTHDDSFILLKTSEFLLKNSSPCRDYLLVEPESNPEEILCGSLHRIFEARSFKLHFQTQLTSFKGFLLSYEATSGVTVSCQQGGNRRPPSMTTTKPATAVPTTSTLNLPTAHQGHSTTTQLPRSIKQPQDVEGSPFERESFADIEGTESDTDDIQEQTLMVPEQEGVNPDSADASSPERRPPSEEYVPTEEKEVATPAPHMVSGCFGDIVHFQCKDGELIRIVEDLYGSAPSGRCTYEENDCVVEAVGQKSIVSQICSSKTRCMNFIVTRMFCGDRVTSYQQITYECVPATAMLNICSKTVLKTSEGYLSSPNFPGMYPRNQSCSCVLRAEGDTVHLSMAHFALHDLKTCEDWLEIDLGDEAPAYKLCGSQHGDFRARSITLTFNSDAKYSHSGFWLHFQGESGGMVTMACNVDIDSVWPTTSTQSTTAPSTPIQAIRGAENGGSSLGNLPGGQDANNPLPPHPGSVNKPGYSSSKGYSEDHGSGPAGGRSNSQRGNAVMSDDLTRQNGGVGAGAGAGAGAGVVRGQGAGAGAGAKAEGVGTRMRNSKETEDLLKGRDVPDNGQYASVDGGVHPTTTHRLLTRDKKNSSESLHRTLFGTLILVMIMVVLPQYV